MAKEAQEPENGENPEGAEEVAHPMFNKTGMIVFGSVVVFLLGLFAFMLIYVAKPDEIPDTLQKKKAPKSVMDLNAPRLDIDKPIIVSIPTNELATEFRHLAITLSIIIGRLDDEYTDDFDLMKALAAEQFLETAEKFTPYVQDRVNKLASSYSYLSLQESTTRTELAQRLRDELNDILKQYNMKPRISEVLIKSFIFSD